MIILLLTFISIPSKKLEDAAFRSHGLVLRYGTLKDMRAEKIDRFSEKRQIEASLKS